ncbi:probable myosin-binding protein 5 isoform X1 [Solanum lycopersicum]|uniref:GTD-binding domain-containing protein n=1 Tax=Solanum lycopersicum TaxID=4081 RepID=A0A3Q7JUK5_SOLLC|nr:probable myosin-binding protein 5 isoform X1 [Solanum lycopersicum]XP_019066893.1 probable myosin-binding protein 5 isoform X1 [Solanum lycopersicum]
MAFKCCVEQKMGKFAFFLIYALLEWVMILLLFIEGFLAFFSNEYAKLFDLKIPCLLCTRIDHILVHRDASFYYNDSICEVHKKDISSLAYCHVHKKLSDIKNMCEGCLLSFATEKDADCDRYKSLVGILHKDIDCFVKDALHTKKEDNEVMLQTTTSFVWCSCCGEPLKMRSKSNPSSQAPWRNEDYTQLKFISDNDLDDGAGREDNIKGASEEINDNALKTANFTRNMFFGIPLSDSCQASPRWSHRPRKLSMELISESNDVVNESDNDILHRLKRQVHLDHKSVIALYMELDEERSAAAVAANNAMAMITRLQAEKAAVQMEALQYQRMMEEQAEYDQEALQVMKDLLLKREEDIKVMEVVVETYRERYGDMKGVGSEVCEVGEYQEWNSYSFSSLSERSTCVSPDEGDQHRLGPFEPHLDFEHERCYLMGLLTKLEDKITTSKDGFYESEGKGSENKAILRTEVSVIRERLSAIEAESMFLKHATMTLQRDDEGIKLLTEIAQHLRRLRQSKDGSA